jgi:hypothetical protein
MRQRCGLYTLLVRHMEEADIVLMSAPGLSLEHALTCQASRVRTTDRGECGSESR